MKGKRKLKTSDILGYEVQAKTAEICVDSIASSLVSDERHCVWMACLNPHSYAVARRDPAFQAALSTANWLVPDGVGIIIAAQILFRPVAERITGFDIFSGVMAKLNHDGGSVFFLGSSENTLKLISKKVCTDYPNVQLAGTYSPPFKSKFSKEENEAIISAISQSGADVLWVGMSAPKQEKWIAANSVRLPVKFTGAIGAVFDFYTGQVPRPHPIFQRAGLEWLPRLINEPRRLWRRMFISAPIFLYYLFLEVIQKRKNIK